MLRSVTHFKQDQARILGIMRIIKTCVLAGLLGSLLFAGFGVGQERRRTVDPRTSAVPQEPAQDIVRVNTRVVFIDTLVKDKRTGEPVDGLKREDFEVLDNGRPRVISYFGTEADVDNRPLALLLVIAPLDDGAAKSLQTPEVTNSLAAALAKLPTRDEVALMLVWRHGTYAMLTDLTRDRATVISALAALPKRETLKGASRPPKVIQDSALALALHRPRSQTRVVLVTDSVFLISDGERDEMIRNLIKANITFNALITGTDPFFAVMSPLLKPAQDNLGARWYDVPQFWARQTGGDYVRAGKRKDYGPALEKLLGDLASRYSLGFTLGDDELNDGQMHRLEVRIRARDSLGKERKLEVLARQGYYLPKQ
jgi:Ca-activated chloride channel family protein